MTTLPKNHPLPRGFSQFESPVDHEIGYEVRALRSAETNIADLRRLIAGRNWRGAARCAALMLYDAGDRSAVRRRDLRPDFDRRVLPLLAHNIRRAVLARKNVFAAISRVHDALCG